MDITVRRRVVATTHGSVFVTAASIWSWLPVVSTFNLIILCLKLLLCLLHIVELASNFAEIVVRDWIMVLSHFGWGQLDGKLKSEKTGVKKYENCKTIVSKVRITVFCKKNKTTQW